MSINGLNPTISIFKDKRAQYRREAFEWIHDLIEYVKQDSEAKYYAVRALTANVSMNKNDYTNLKDMARAAEGMHYRPVNLNHNHSAWAPYPRTRVDWSKFSAEDMELEGLLRVDNADVQLQKMLDHSPDIPESEWINHPSVEALPIPATLGGGYQITALALLQKGAALPGDPLTEIVPVYAESLAPSLEKLVCEHVNSVQGEKTMSEPTTETIKKEMQENISKAKVFQEKLTEEELIGKIKECKVQLAALDNKLYPPSTLTDAERQNLRQQKDMVYVELNAYTTALSAMMGMQPSASVEVSVKAEEALIAKDRELLEATEKYSVLNESFTAQKEQLVSVRAKNKEYEGRLREYAISRV